MDKRLDASKSGWHEDVSNHSKKSKKRSSKRNGMLNSWMNNGQNNQNNDVVPGMEHQHALWQSNMQQNFPSNGQRLFTTTSDPSMCGYTQMPMTYTMEPVSLPAMYRLYQPVPFSGIRTIPSRPRRHCNQNHPLNLNMNSMANGYTSLQENGLTSPILINYQNGDYASLPPTANKNNGINGDELNSEHRRYSDPGLGSAEVPTQSEDPDSADSGSSITTIGRSNKLVWSLIEQMTELKKSNSQLFKELNETKSELGSMKTKLTQCKYNGSSDYQPGMLSDFIREIRQANKTCEEGLVAKVKSIVEEKLNQRSLEMVNLNNQIVKLMEEKKESDRRISKLEEEVATLRLNANNEGRVIAAFEEETLALRRELQEARSSKSLAENQTAKCVNARSVTPVDTFGSPYVTSTPVRTALSDTCSLLPSFSSHCSSSLSFSAATTMTTANTNTVFSCCATGDTASLVHRQRVAVLPRSRATEPAHHDLHDLDKHSTVYGADDCSLSSTASSWTYMEENRGTTSSTDLKETSNSAGSDPALDEKNEGDSGRRLEDHGIENVGQPEETDRRRTSGEQTNVDGDTEIVEPTAERNLAVNEAARSSPTEEKRSTKDTKVNDEAQSRGGQRGGSKKSRKRKGGNAATRRSNGETDRPATSGTSNETTIAKEGRRTVSEDEARHDDEETCRAITEIPDVTVVGGGSLVPTDLCSTGILTSRVLTAPSRATYTTAYI